MSETKSKASDASSPASGPRSTPAASTSTSTAGAPPATASSQFADHVRSFNNLFSDPKPRPAPRPTTVHVFRRSDLAAMLTRLDALEQGLAEWKRTTKEHMQSAGAEINVQRFRQDRVEGDYPRLVGYIAEIRRETANMLNNHTETLRTHRALLDELRGEVKQRDEALDKVMRWVAAAQRTGRLPVPQALMARGGAEEEEEEAHQAEGGGGLDSRGGAK